MLEYTIIIFLESFVFFPRQSGSEAYLLEKVTERNDFVGGSLMVHNTPNLMEILFYPRIWKRDT